MEEIQEKIEALEAALKSEIKNTLLFGIFNPKVTELKNAIKKLQAECTHYYRDGVCVICHKKGGK